MKKSRGAWYRVASLLLLAAAVALLLSSPALAARAPAKNVIVLIADGCSSEQYTLARWFKGAPLALDGIRVGAVKTYTTDSVIADSAPAASAFATGVRTSDDFISVGPREVTLSVVPRPDPELRYRPLATVLEGAKLLGKSTGIVATSRVSHATPAAYMAHVASRNREDDIMEQAVYQNVDVVLGGGKRHLLGKTDGGKRADGENLLDVLKERRYQIVETRDEMVRCKAGRVFGMFAMSHMEAEIDRQDRAPQQPTLEEMTRKAIEILSKNPCGFFLMVEA
ncbi:MAG TPA: alkaline phosphatase, partial [Syntrophobacteria bacterium]|nr:alkaline phosphatase [Syntrophobacteria bacterium]